MTYGLTPQGWRSKPLSVVKAELEQKIKAILGESAGTEPDGSLPSGSLAGQLLVLLADPAGDFWDLGQAIVAAFDPAKATGVAQDAVNSITGTVRDPATYSTSIVTCAGAPLTPLSKGRVLTVATTNARFLSEADATIGAAQAWSNNGGLGTNYAVGDVVTNAGSVYLCRTAGLGSTTTGPSTKDADITDGTAHWRFVGTGIGYVNVAFQAEQTGPIGALAGSLSTIATPVQGWTGAVNLEDADVGSNRESDVIFRYRREAELHSQGDAAQDAIRARVLAVGQGTSAPVTSVTVFSNRTDVTSDGITPPNIPTGMPPHSVMVVADYEGGTHANTDLEQAIAQAIWDAVGAGIATTFGPAVGDGYAFTSTVTDSEGNTQTVYWARPLPKPVYLVANVTYDNTPGAFPVDGSDQIVGALLTEGGKYKAGKNVWASALSAAIFDGPISPEPGSENCPGILDVASLYIGLAPAPGTSTPIPISLIERAVFDSARITVNLTGAVP